MSTASEVMKKLSKDYGTGVVKIGGDAYEDVSRLPSGIFALDLASGGGFPMGKLSIVYGMESSGKTNVALKSIAQGHRIFPDKKAVFLDLEHAYDPQWAAKLGVDQNKIIVVSPEYAEQAVDIVEAFLYATDIYVIVVDSLAAMSTQNEIDSSAEKASVGGSSLLIGKMCRKVTTSFSRMRNQGLLAPSFIAINQIRNKIGVMYGDPETMPGGNAPRYASSFTLRLYGKNEMDKKINSVLPAYKKTSIIIKKWKFPILATTSEFMMQMVDGAGRPAGFVDDWNTVSNYMKELDYLVKAKARWVMCGEEFQTLEAAKTALYANEKLLAEVKATLIKELLDKGNLKEPSQDMDDEEVAL